MFLSSTPLWIAIAKASSVMCAKFVEFTKSSAKSTGCKYDITCINSYRGISLNLCHYSHTNLFVCYNIHHQRKLFYLNIIKLFYSVI